MDTQQLVKLGARARLEELDNERAELIKVLNGRPVGRPKNGRSKRKPMSAARKKALSAKLKAVWAARKAGAKK